MSRSRMFVPQPEEPTVAVAHVQTWPYGAEQAVEPVDGVLATEHMYWRASGSLAYPAGRLYPPAETALLVGETEHMANLRYGQPPASPVLEYRGEAPLRGRRP
jgi:hypothetical protein